MTDELEKEGTDITSSPLRWKSAQIGINVLFLWHLRGVEEDGNTFNIGIKKGVLANSCIHLESS